jgi:hypothetical protein
MQQDLTLPSDQSASRSDVPLSKLQVLKGRGQLEVEVVHNELQRQGWGQSSRYRLDGLNRSQRCRAMTAISAFLPSTASPSHGSKFPPNGRIKGPAVIGFIHTPQRCTSANRRALHDDKARPLQVLHQALGDSRRYEFICVVDALAPIVNARRMGSRLFTASLTITRKWDYLRAAWEDDRPWPTRRAPIVDVVP